MSRRRNRASATLLVLVLLVVGCSDSDPKEEAKPTATKPTTPGEKVAASLGCTATVKAEPVGGYADADLVSERFPPTTGGIDPCDP